jgi:hypothetical protein
MKIGDLCFRCNNNTIWIAAMLLFFIFTSCDKRKPNYSQVSGENYLSEIIKAIDLQESYQAFIFMSPECPLSENYSKTINELAFEYKRMDIGFYIVHS